MQTGAHIKLPDLHVHDEVVELTPDERATYDHLEREFCLDFFDNAEVTAKTSADLSMKLLQISSGAIYEDGQSRKWHNVNAAKINALRELLSQYDENIVVVYQFRHEVERILAAFPSAREFKKEQDFREWNEGKIRLLLIHPKSAGHGLNLQFGGRRMVWFTPTWNLGHYLQTVARLLRRRQEHAVHVHRLIAKGTRDEKVKRRIGCKDSNQKFLMDEIKALRQKYER
jgi:SNF2 family DNA or RNA helicase